MLLLELVFLISFLCVFKDKTCNSLNTFAAIYICFLLLKIKKLITQDNLENTNNFEYLNDVFLLKIKLNNDLSN